jgi:hypothetical protein
MLFLSGVSGLLEMTELNGESRKVTTELILVINSQSPVV